MKTLIALGMTASLWAMPAMAMEFGKGDRACLGYDAESHSCLSVQEVVEASGGTVTVEDRTKLRLGVRPLTLVSRGSMVAEDGRYCLKAGSLDYRGMPETHAYSGTMPKMMARQMGVLAKAGLCVTHRTCGDAMVVDSTVRGVARPSMRQVFRVFRADDPKAASLTGRVTTASAMRREGAVLPAGC